MKFGKFPFLLFTSMQVAQSTGIFCGDSVPSDCVHSFLNDDGTTCCQENLAYQKPTDQSSTRHGGVSSKAVDRNRDPNFNGGSVTHTNIGGGPSSIGVDGETSSFNWWKVDLQEEFIIDYIDIYNRMDCCSDRLSNAQIVLFDSQVQWVATETYGSTTGKDVIAVSFLESNPVARFVIIYVPGDQPLSLAEVEVFGRNPVTSTPTPEPINPNTVAPTSSPTQLFASSMDDMVEYHLHEGAMLLLDFLELPEHHAPNFVEEVFSMNDEEFATMEITDFPAIHLIDGKLEELNENIGFQTQSVSNSVSPCVIAAGFLVSDVVSLFLSLLGIAGSSTEIEGEAIKLIANDPTFLAQVAESVQGFSTANGLERAKAIFRVGTLLWNSGTITRSIIQAISHMPWYQKARFIATATATLISWFATESFALVAQIVLALTNLPSLVENAIDVTHECS